MSTQVGYPVRVEATLDRDLSRWMWLVKWFLAIPHFVVLAFLWMAYGLLSVVAFFAILFTGRYPKGIFEFNVGVLRWSWRVSYYSFGAFATDRYPPFTLSEVEDYPAHFEVSYPETLSRGLVLIKWWLLAIPHYLITGILVGGTWFAWKSDEWQASGIGLIGVLALIAVITMAVTGTYPKGLFDLILGFNRWVLRVAAYVGLMTDQYPPFRLDTGSSEPGSTLAVTDTEQATEDTAGSSTRGWTAGPVISLISGVVISFMAIGIGGAGAIGLWADQTQRDAAGYLTTDSRNFDTGTYAIVSEDIELTMEGPDVIYPERILGNAQITATSATGGEIFLGVGPADEVDRYLEGVGYATATGFSSDLKAGGTGGAPDVAPAEAGIWHHSSEGTGKQAVTWVPEDGTWSIVVMNADGSPGVTIDASAGIEAPALTGFAIAFIVAGGVLLLLAIALVGGAAARAASKS